MAWAETRGRLSDAETAEAQARARAESAEAEMGTKAAEDAEAARAEIAEARSQRDIARMAARRAAAAAEDHWRGRMAEANAEVQQAGERAEAARADATCSVAAATARMLSATQELQVQRTSYESEIASLRREIQAIFNSTIWRASAPLRMAASWLPSAVKRAARGGLRAIYWVLPL
jgi:chromosome segregation ATPase